MTDPRTYLRRRVRALASGLRFGKFVSVGVVGATFDFTVLTVLTSLGVLAELANLAGIETAILVMFAINERWTFAAHAESGEDTIRDRLIRSHLVRAGGAITQMIIFTGVYRAVPIPEALVVPGIDAWLFVAKVSGVAGGMVVNYVFESLFTWQVHLD